MQKLAANLDKAIRENIPLEQISTMLNTFSTVHGKLIASLTAAFPPIIVRKERSKVDETKAKAIYIKMIELLANDDSEIVDYL